MIANMFGDDAGIVAIIIALVVLFGGSRLPKIAKNLGGAGREFRKAQREAEAEETKVQLATAPAPALSQPPAADQVTISRTDLDAILAKRPPEPQDARGRQ
jgi:sec-independent protein translocase protein TatA